MGSVSPLPGHQCKLWFPVWVSQCQPQWIAQVRMIHFNYGVRPVCFSRIIVECRPPGSLGHNCAVCEATCTEHPLLLPAYLSAVSLITLSLAPPMSSLSQWWWAWLPRMFVCDPTSASEYLWHGFIVPVASILFSACCDNCFWYHSSFLCKWLAWRWRKLTRHRVKELNPSHPPEIPTNSGSSTRPCEELSICWYAFVTQLQ